MLLTFSQCRSLENKRLREVRDQRLRDEDVPESRVSERPDDGHFAPELLDPLPDVDDQFPGGRDVGELVLKPGIFLKFQV